MHWFASRTVIRNVKVPVAVGVPEREPPASVTPGGGEPDVRERLYGPVPPFPLIVRWYGTPTKPSKSVDGETERVSHPPPLPIVIE